MEFLVFRKQANEKRKAKKTRKTIYTGKLPTSKRRTRKSFWLLFLVLQQFKLGRKIKRSKKYVFGLSQSFSNTQEESEKNKFKHR